MKSKKGRVFLSVLMLFVSIALTMITAYNIIPIKLLDTLLTVLGAVLFLTGAIWFFRAVKSKA